MSNRSNRAQMYEDLSADFGASLGNPKSVAQKNQKGLSGPHLQPGFHIRSGVRASRRSAYHTANADMILLQPTTPFTIAQPANELTGQHSILASPIQFNDIQHDHDPYTGYFPASSIGSTQSYRPHVLEHDMSIAFNDSEPSFSTFPFDGYYAAPLKPMIGDQQSPPISRATTQSTMLLMTTSILMASILANPILTLTRPRKILTESWLCPYTSRLLLFMLH